MKIQKLTSGLITALVLSSPIVGAEEYPAANFEPTVIYNDSDYKHSGSSTTTSGKKAETSKPDPKYPAANFQPEVVFSDDGYKHHQAESSTKKSTSSSNSSVSAASENTSEVAAENPEESMTTLFGLVALVVVGFALFKKKPGSCPRKAAKEKAKE